MSIPAAVLFQEFKRHLNMTADDDDDDLATTLGAATGAAEGLIGPVVIRSFTSMVRGGGAIFLPKYPIQSVSTLTHGLAREGPYATAHVLFDAEIGRVILTSGARFCGGSWTVVYTAGRWHTATEVSDDVRLAVCIIGKHLWETQRGVASRPGMLGRTSNGDATDRVPMGFAIPSRAATLLEPYAQSSTSVA